VLNRPLSGATGYGTPNYATDGRRVLIIAPAEGAQARIDLLLR
jgi:hypothetical protein